MRAARRGQAIVSQRRRDRLSDPLRQLFEAPLALVCSELAQRVTTAVRDPRAADACIRFYGLGRLPEDLTAIGASLPHAQHLPKPLGARRVKQLIELAEQRRAEDLVTPLDSCARSPFSAPARPHAREPGWNQLRLLLRAWADVPDGDQQSAAALILWESEAGLRPASETPLHRETRRRLLDRAHAILTVAAQRYTPVAPSSAEPHIDMASELLLGPRARLATNLLSALDDILRTNDRPTVPDAEALRLLCDHARELVHAGSTDAAAILGVARIAVTRADAILPIEIPLRVLTLSTVLARSQDDPAGFPAAWEALRLAHQAMANGSASPPVVSQSLRALQELAELQDRFGFAEEALRTLAAAYDLLTTHGDPEAEEEPDGWLQQLLYSQAIVQRRASRSRPDPRAYLRQAQHAAAQSALLVRKNALLPQAWGLTVEAVLAEAVVDEAAHEMSAGSTGRALAVVARARNVIAHNEAGWRSFDGYLNVMARSARMAVIRAAGRLALVTGDVDAYSHHLERARQEAGPWMLPVDIEEIDALEAAAARVGVTSSGVAKLGLTPSQRVGQRMWAMGVARAIATPR